MAHVLNRRALNNDGTLPEKCEEIYTNRDGKKIVIPNYLSKQRSAERRLLDQIRKSQMTRVIGGER